MYVYSCGQHQRESLVYMANTTVCLPRHGINAKPNGHGIIS